MAAEKLARIEAWSFVLAVVALAVSLSCDVPLVFAAAAALWTVSSYAGLRHGSVPRVPLPFGARGEVALAHVDLVRATGLLFGPLCSTMGVLH